MGGRLSSTSPSAPSQTSAFPSHMRAASGGGATAPRGAGAAALAARCRTRTADTPPLPVSRTTNVQGRKNGLARAGQLPFGQAAAVTFDWSSRSKKTGTGTGRCTNPPETTRTTRQMHPPPSVVLAPHAPPRITTSAARPPPNPTRKITRYIPGFESPKSRVDGGEKPLQTAVKRPQHTSFPGINMDAGCSTGL